jgi:16S rRNA (adenine1518-N6/adenine1519-N6)-dimethyltransferase
VVEIDPELRAPLEEALAPFDNASLHFADAVEMNLAALRPPPTKVVANLPYGVAATVILKSVAELPDASLWVAMVQREVGERLAAEPGSKLYGITSVLAQLASAALVHAGFAHRRKALAGSVALAPGAPGGLRESTRQALDRLGHPRDARAERLAPGDWPRLADQIGRERLAALSPR